MERGEIWLVSLDPTQGHEQQGRRPVLIVSPTKFNQRMGTPLVAPISSGGRFARTAGFVVSLDEAGTQTTGSVLCNQLRTLDLNARQAVRLESVPAATLDLVLRKLRTLVS